MRRSQVPQGDDDGIPAGDEGSAPVPGMRGALATETLRAAGTEAAVEHGNGAGTGDGSGAENANGTGTGTGNGTGTGTGNGSGAANGAGTRNGSGARSGLDSLAGQGNRDGRDGSAPAHTGGPEAPGSGSPLRSDGRVPGPRPVPGTGGLRGVLRRTARALALLLRNPVAAPVLLATVLHLTWFWLVANGGGDLAAQDAWAEFVDAHPDSAYNLAWYGGLHPFSYSVLSPYLMAALGVRTTLILAGIVSALLLALLLRRVLRKPLLPALWGAFSFTCNAASGRVTFALGVLFALAAVALVWAWPRRWWRERGGLRWLRGAATALLAGLATTGSPVAGLFLEVVAAALFLDRRRQAAYSLAVAPPFVVAASALFFPFEGMQPMPWWSALFPCLGAVSAYLLAPRSWRTVRLGALVYGVGTVLSWAIPSQVGSNVERLSLLFGVVTLMAAAPRVVGSWRSRRGKAMIAALVVAAGWQVAKPAYDVTVTTPDAAWAGELAPLVHQLKSLDADRGRVEVVPVRSHREASALAPYVNLARGWNRQADTDRNPLFYEDGGLSASTYHDWLRRWAVRYVVLPADDPDGAGAEEARIVGAGQPYLREVWGDADWRLYRVADPLPLAAPPARVLRAGADEVTVRVRRRGAVLIRIPWSPWLGLVDGAGHHIEPPSRAGRNVRGCLRNTAPQVGGRPTKGAPVLDTWTLLEAPRAGTYHLAAPYKLPRGTLCPAGEDEGGNGSVDGDGADRPRTAVPPPLAPPRQPPLP